MPHDDIYTGRFAPSPTGPLHAGSLVAALASWLDARAQGGRWLVRIEDVDTPRCIPGMARVILDQLAACGLVPDAPPLVQSQRSSAYQDALDRLVATGLAWLDARSVREAVTNDRRSPYSPGLGTYARTRFVLDPDLVELGESA